MILDQIKNQTERKIRNKFTTIIQEEDDLFVATCIENNIASQGKSINEAISNLREAIELYYEDEPIENITFPNEQFYITTLEVAL